MAAPRSPPATARPPHRPPAAAPRGGRGTANASNPPPPADAPCRRREGRRRPSCECALGTTPTCTAPRRAPRAAPPESPRRFVCSMSSALPISQGAESNRWYTARNRAGVPTPMRARVLTEASPSVPEDTRTPGPMVVGAPDRWLLRRRIAGKGRGDAVHRGRKNYPRSEISDGSERHAEVGRRRGDPTPQSPASPPPRISSAAGTSREPMFDSRRAATEALTASAASIAYYRAAIALSAIDGAYACPTGVNQVLWFSRVL